MKSLVFHSSPRIRRSANAPSDIRKEMKSDLLQVGGSLSQLELVKAKCLQAVLDAPAGSGDVVEQNVTLGDVPQLLAPPGMLRGGRGTSASAK